MKALSSKIRTSVVGGQPGWQATPRRINENTWFYQGRRCPYAEVKSLVAEKLEACICAQEAIGLDILSEGELFRFHYVNYLPRFIDGIEDEGDDLTGYSSLCITGPLRLRTNAPLEDWQRAQQYATRPVKINLPGPHIFSEKMPSTYYHDEASCCLAYAEVLNQVMRELIAAGCRWIQLDDPQLAWDPDKAAHHGLAGLKRALKGLPIEDVNIVVHLCRANHYSFQDAKDIVKLTTHYDALTEPMDSIGVTALSIEGPCHQESINEDYNFFSFPSKNIMLGVVDINVERVESVACLQSKISNALKKVSPDKLIISPNCGMKHFSVELGYQKLRHMVEAVTLCNQELVSSQKRYGTVR